MERGSQASMQENLDGSEIGEKSKLVGAVDEGEELIDGNAVMNVRDAIRAQTGVNFEEAGGFQ